jgi:hypothetical protein
VNSSFSNADETCIEFRAVLAQGDSPSVSSRNQPSPDQEQSLRELLSVAIMEFEQPPKQLPTTESSELETLPKIDPETISSNDLSSGLDSSNLLDVRGSVSLDASTVSTNPAVNSGSVAKPVEQFSPVEDETSRGVKQSLDPETELLVLGDVISPVTLDSVSRTTTLEVESNSTDDQTPKILELGNQATTMAATVPEMTESKEISPPSSSPESCNGLVADVEPHSSSMTASSEESPAPVLPDRNEIEGSGVETETLVIEPVVELSAGSVANPLVQPDEADRPDEPGLTVEHAFVVESRVEPALEPFDGSAVGPLSNLSIKVDFECIDPATELPIDQIAERVESAVELDSAVCDDGAKSAEERTPEHADQAVESKVDLAIESAVEDAVQLLAEPPLKLVVESFVEPDTEPRVELPPESSLIPPPVELPKAPSDLPAESLVELNPVVEDIAGTRLESSSEHPVATLVTQTPTLSHPLSPELVVESVQTEVAIDHIAKSLVGPDVDQLDSKSDDTDPVIESNVGLDSSNKHERAPANLTVPEPVADEIGAVVADLRFSCSALSLQTSPRAAKFASASIPGAPTPLSTPLTAHSTKTFPSETVNQSSVFQLAQSSSDPTSPSSMMDSTNLSLFPTPTPVSTPHSNTSTAASTPGFAPSIPKQEIRSPAIFTPTPTPAPTPATTPASSNSIPNPHGGTLNLSSPVAFPDFFAVSVSPNASDYLEPLPGSTNGLVGDDSDAKKPEPVRRDRDSDDSKTIQYQKSGALKFATKVDGSPPPKLSHLQRILSRLTWASIGKNKERSRLAGEAARRESRGAVFSRKSVRELRKMFERNSGVNR